MPDALAPGFLIAVPQLLDGNFNRSVVLLMEHNDEGAFGLVINRPSGMKVSDLVSNLGIDYSGDPDALVLTGGPVQPERGLILHRGGEPGEDCRRVVGSTFVSSTPDTLRQLFSRGGRNALCFSGYSGWGPNQLEREIEDGSWILSGADESLIFESERETIWERALRNMGIDPKMIVQGGSVS